LFINIVNRNRNPPAYAEFCITSQANGVTVNATISLYKLLAFRRPAVTQVASTTSASRVGYQHNKKEILSYVSLTYACTIRTHAYNLVGIYFEKTGYKHKWHSCILHNVREPELSEIYLKIRKL
jgi:hypothetical protein